MATGKTSPPGLHVKSSLPAFVGSCQALPKQGLSNWQDYWGRVRMTELPGQADRASDRLAGLLDQAGNATGLGPE